MFALDLLEMYREDRGSVDPSWRSYFDKATGRPTDGETAPVTVIVQEAAKPAEAKASAPAAPLQTLVRQESQAVAPRQRSVASRLPATGSSPSGLE